jgi:quinol monooxygenase YgiN
MFAGMLEVVPKMEKKDEFIRVVRQEVLPILKKQPGFLDMIPLVPEIASERWIAITLWTDKRHAEKYVSEVYPRVEKIVKSFLGIPVAFRTFNVETTLCEHLVEALTTAA